MLTYYPQLSHPCTYFKSRKKARKNARQSAPAPAAPGHALCTGRRIFLSTLAGGPPPNTWARGGPNCFGCHPAELVARRGAEPDLTAPCKKCARHSALWCQRAAHNLRRKYCMSAKLIARKREKMICLNVHWSHGSCPDHLCTCSVCAGWPNVNWDCHIVPNAGTREPTQQRGLFAPGFGSKLLFPVSPLCRGAAWWADQCLANFSAAEYLRQKPFYVALKIVPHPPHQTLTIHNTVCKRGHSRHQTITTLCVK